MNRLFSLKTLSIIGLLLLIQQKALCYEYKLYDTQTKISYNAQMITIEAPKKHFYLGLYAPSSGKPMYCVIEDKINKNAQGLLGGDCYGILYESAHKYNWRELNVNNFVKEKNDIIIERKQDRLKYAPAVFDFSKKD